MRRDGGSVFPAHANTGDPNGPIEALSANEIAGALISMMARSETLKSKAGYTDSVRSTSPVCKPARTLMPSARASGIA